MTGVLRALLEAAALGLLGTVGVALALALLGAGRRPPPLAAVNDAFAQRPLPSGPPPRTARARDGTPLGYRFFPAARPRCTLLLVHGSSADGRSMVVLGQALADAGCQVLAPDIRGHGLSGRRGDIDHVGQLEEDVADLLDHAQAQGECVGPLLYMGHSSGGGFGLRLAASPLADRFAGFVLAAPMVHHASPLARPGVGGWAVPFLPRLVGLTILHALHLRFLEHLPVLAFATPEGDTTRTSQYSFRLQTNFRPPRNWRPTARAVRKPVTVLIGAEDELFDASAYPAQLGGLSPLLDVQVLPGLKHVHWYFAPTAVQALLDAVQRLLAHETHPGPP